MSDVTGLDRSFGLPGVAMLPPLLEELPPHVTAGIPPEIGAEHVSFRPLHGPAEIRRILHLRGEIQLPASALGDAGFALREKKRDEIGLVGAFLCYGETIGTLRVLPMTHGLAPCEKLVVRHAISEELLDHAWEVGRLVLDPRYRFGPEFLRRCLFLTIVHTMRHHRLDNLFASCTPVLARLYRRFGFRALVKDAAADAEGSYSLIHGLVPDVVRALAGNAAERALAEDILLEREAALAALQ